MRQIEVKHKPFIMLAGEVHNSNASSPEYMEKVWDKGQRLGMNSLFLPVTWEMIEPEEGIFDFTIVDKLIMQARERDMHIGFLWFGAWKNAQCYYAPEWVKTDLVRFPRAQVEKGKNFVHLEQFYGMAYTSLSYLGEETKQADAKAFGSLMTHIKEIDEEQQTVVCIQVENETGLQGAGREHSEMADSRFAEDVPQNFVEYMRKHVDTMSPEIAEAVRNGDQNGSWSQVFGKAADEIFSAYHIATFVNYVAKTGKEIYDLPMTANCWLDKGEEPGNYPSGGPVAKMMEVWKYCAPAIDIIAPDIYVPDFCDVCDQYIKCDNPLFIPETETHSLAGSREIYAVGHYHAYAFSPFGFEEMGEAKDDSVMALFGAAMSGTEFSKLQDTDEYHDITRALHELMPELTAKYGTSQLQAAISERQEDAKLVFEKFTFEINFESPLLPAKNGACLVLQKSENEFYLLVKGAAFAATSNDESKPYVDVLLFEEGQICDGVWKRGRRLNGDELVLAVFEKPVLLRIRLFAYA